MKLGIAKYLFFQVILLCVILTTQAQAPHYKQFGEDDGLPSGLLYSTVQDSKGYIWVSSADGIARYNGYKFEKITVKEGLLKNDVWGFFEDNFGHIWLKTNFNEAMKIQYFDLKTNRIVTIQLPTSKILHRKSKAHSLATGQLIFEMIDRETIGLHLSSYNDANGSCFYAFLKPSATGVAVVDAPKTVLDLYKNNLTDTIEESKLRLVRGFRAVEFGKSSIVWRFWNNKWRQVGQIKVRFDDFLKINVDNILFISDSTFVIGHGNRVSLWHNKKGLLGQYIASSPFDFMDSQTKNLILLKTKTELVLLDNQLKPTEYTTHFDFLNTWKVRIIYEDRQQNLWITTEDNSLRLISKQALLHSQSYNLGEAARHIAQDPLRRLWIGTQSGRVLYKLPSPVFSGATRAERGGGEAKPIEAQLSSPFTQYIRGMACAPDGSLWIANDRQIVRIDVGKNSLLSQFMLTEHYDLNRLQMGENGDFMVVGIYKSLKMFENKIWTTAAVGGFSVESVNKNYYCKQVTNGRCYALQPTNEGVFVGRLDGLYLQTDSARIKTIPQTAISDLALVQNKLYVATQSEGLYCYDIVSQKAIKITGVTNGNIHKLVTDGAQSLWVCSQTDGLVKVVDYQVVQKIAMVDGLPSNEVFDVLTEKQKLTIATAKGITTIEQAPMPSLQAMASVSLTLKSIRFSHSGRDSTLIFPDTKQKLVLDNDQNNLVFEVNNLDYHSPKSALYSYLLVRNNDTISVLSKPENIYELRFLDSGSYRLVVSEANGVSMAYDFEILKPIYQRWWFWLIVSGLVAGFVYYRVRLNMRRASMELRALQGQMNAHFAANFMEVVKNMVVKENKIAAFNSLSTFGGLMRDFVVASRNKKIAIADEVGFLERYIELAKLVYGLKKTDTYDKTLTDEIVIDTDIAPQTYIRPLLIQPIVENVFKYGIFHKEAPSNLSIRFEAHSPTTIKCTVEDDGVGRGRVAEIQAQEKADLKQVLKKELTSSKGSIQAMKEAGVKITIIDLPQGTRVELILETFNSTDIV